MTSPWLAPDGREWGAHRLRRLPRIAGSLHKFCSPARVFLPPTRTPVSRSIRFLVAEINAAGPSARAALWELFRK